MSKGSINLHGHSHGMLKEQTRQYDVGVDAWDYRPVTLDIILTTRRRSPPGLPRRVQRLLASVAVSATQEV